MEGWERAPPRGFLGRENHLLKTLEASGSYIRVLDTNRTGFMDMEPVSHSKPWAQEGLLLGLCSTVTILKFLVSFERGALHFHFSLGPIKYVGSPGCGSSILISLVTCSHGRVLGEKRRILISERPLWSLWF